MPRSAFALLFAALFGLSACAPLQPVEAPAAGSGENAGAAAPQGSTAETGTSSGSLSEEAYHERIAEVSKILRAVCTAPVNQPYFDKTPCLPPGITEKHLTDKTRITAAQKKAAEQVFARIHRLNEDTRKMMIESGNPEYARLARTSLQVVDPRVDALQRSLLSGQITWGEYNRERLEIFEETSSRSQ